LNEIPTEYSLTQNYPNPFNPSTKITYSIPEASLVTIKIYDITGNDLETLINEEKVVGAYEITWDGSNYPSGIYFYKIEAGNFVETKKLVLIK
jgi:flagellar hook assembly protein FlgD